MILKWLSYPRSIFFTLLYPLWLIGISGFGLICTYFHASRNFKVKILSWWGRGSCWMFGVKVRLLHRENMPAGGCVYLYNHTSFFDIFAMLASMPTLFYGAKAELFKIPVFGRAGTRFGMIQIPRAQRTQAIRNLRQAEERFAQGDQFALAPEGTRMPSEKLGPFKSGPFILAIEGQVPVVPVIIQNAAPILPKNHWFPNWGVWQREIVITIESPISTVGMTVENDKERLKKIVRDVMNRYIPNA